MTADQLLEQLRLVNRCLSDLGATRLAKDLESFAQMLEPHRGRRIEDLLDAAPKPKVKAVKVDSEDVARRKSMIVDLYARADRDGMNQAEIERVFHEVNLPSLTLDQIKSIADQVNAKRVGTKPAIISAIKKSIELRMGMTIRAGM